MTAPRPSSPPRSEQSAAAPGAAEPGPAAHSARARRRRLWLGLLTLCGLSRRGFFIPNSSARSVTPAGARAPYPAAEARLAGRAAACRQVLAWADELGADLARIGTEPAPAPRWTQGWFPRLDGAVAYTLVRRLRPRRIVEVGAGHSTRFLAAAARDGGLEARLTAIDPAPRASLAGLPVELLRRPVQQVDPGVFAALGAGDVLAIDSSHVLMPGSDVDVLLNRVLPALPAGVLVHVHDIFLPDDYPAAWDWRGYNEQLGVLPLLLGAGWEVVFASHYAASRLAAAVEASVVGRLPRPDGALESSLWLERR